MAGVLRHRRQVHVSFSDDNQDGYFAPDISETAKGNTVRDIKEFFHVYPWGRYPTEVSDAALQYAATPRRSPRPCSVGSRPTPARDRGPLLAAAQPMMDGSERTLLRVLRYPPLGGDEARRRGAGRGARGHQPADVLPAANEPGLQVRDTAGNWHDVPCDFGSLVINCGDMLALASGGYYPSTTHRVMNPTGEARHAVAAVPAAVPAPGRRRRARRTAHGVLVPRRADPRVGGRRPALMTSPGCAPPGDREIRSLACSPLAAFGRTGHQSTRVRSSAPPRSDR